jgi:hypothetical protein
MSGPHAGARLKISCLLERPHVVPTKDSFLAKVIKKQLQMDLLGIYVRKKKNELSYFYRRVTIGEDEKIKIKL